MIRLKAKKTKGSLLFTDSISRWVGSWSFFNLHIGWFVIWLIVRWDINMLTMIVSLEAIILMILLLMQQNRQVERDDARDEMDLQIDTTTKTISEQNAILLDELKKELKRLENLISDHDKKNP